MASRTTTGTAANAAEITQKLEDAHRLAFEASQAVAKAIELIESGEAEAELKTPQLQHIQGALSLTLSALSGDAASWSLYARARTKRS